MEIEYPRCTASAAGHIPDSQGYANTCLRYAESFPYRPLCQLAIKIDVIIQYGNNEQFVVTFTWDVHHSGEWTALLRNKRSRFADNLRDRLISVTSSADMVSISLPIDVLSNCKMSMK